MVSDLHIVGDSLEDAQILMTFQSHILEEGRRKGRMGKEGEREKEREREKIKRENRKKEAVGQAGKHGKRHFTSWYAYLH